MIWTGKHGHGRAVCLVCSFVVLSVFKLARFLCLFCESQAWPLLRCLKMQRCATQEKNITLEAMRQSHHFEQKRITLQNVQGFWLPLHPAKKKNHVQSAQHHLSPTPLRFGHVLLSSCFCRGIYVSKQQKKNENIMGGFWTVMLFDTSVACPFAAVVRKGCGLVCSQTLMNNKNAFDHKQRQNPTGSLCWISHTFFSLAKIIANKKAQTSVRF